MWTGGGTVNGTAATVFSLREGLSMNTTRRQFLKWLPVAVASGPTLATTLIGDDRPPPFEEGEILTAATLNEHFDYMVEAIRRSLL